MYDFRKILPELNNTFGLLMQHKLEYVKNIGNKVTEIDVHTRSYITKKIPDLIKNILDPNYKVKGSVGTGLLIRTPWVAILDKEITDTATQGIYIAFLFSSDLTSLYITLNQGTTVPGKFGVRLSPKEIINQRQNVRFLLDDLTDNLLVAKNDLDIADKVYKEGTIFYTQWNYQEKQDALQNRILNKYLDLYNTYKQRIKSKNEKGDLPADPHLTDLSYAHPYRKYFSTIQTKPFVLLAGISGTGKSRIVRKLAKMTCYPPSLQDPQKPGNYEMIQVRPNWYDSTELMGYISRIGNEGPRYVATRFLQFLVKAWYFHKTPFFLCLDEMNLAPVEQYFAEYLSVIETRELRKGQIITDPLIPVGTDHPVHEKLIDELLSEPLFDDSERTALLKTQFLQNGISIPSNFIVMGTVNMDETTYSFSRKVLDRAMTIEMNEVNLYEGLSDNTEEDDSSELISARNVLPCYVEGKDVYSTYTTICNKVLSHLEQINRTLEGTPFKIAYRTRNEFLVYCVTNFLLAQNNDADLPTWLDELTNMKILSRIEGEKETVKNILNGMKEYFLSGGNSEKKADEMLRRGDICGYVSYWS